MTEFLLEVYVPRTDPATAERAATDARTAAEALRKNGTSISYLRSIFVPDDETCFLLFEADSAEDVLEAARMASLPVEHLVVAIVRPAPEEAPIPAET